MTYQQIKVEYQVPSGNLYPLEILEWKWDKITMSFVSSLPLIPSKKNSVWIETQGLCQYFGDSCNNCWERSYDSSSFQFGNVIIEALYGRRCRSPTYWMELSEQKMVGPDLVRETEEKISFIRNHLKVAQDCKKDYVGLMAYRLALPLELSKKHNISIKSKHTVQVKALEVEPNFSYEEKSVRILAKEVKELRNKRISLVKIFWRNQNTEEAI
ncbi:reverse transcriptase [Gossypium australe]|uniref:Reverse transcriptase n=1 Tax=Gossypium australe TaxID=47621 RepID=A0A5B6VKX4_9ROSI|nr:reverse transcriptase [Gossypium australe]